MPGDINVTVGKYKKEEEWIKINDQKEYKCQNPT
jgi:hypothetical protein